MDNNLAIEKKTWTLIDNEDSITLKLFAMVCACLIVFSHGNNLARYGIHAENNLLSMGIYATESFIQSISRIAVPCFFVIAGYLFFMGWDFSWMFFSQKLRKRTMSVLLPYLVWNVIGYCTYLFGTCISSKVTPVIGWREIAQAVFQHSHNTVFWFMYELWIFFMLAPAFSLLIRNKKWALVCLAIGLVLSYPPYTIQTSVEFLHGGPRAAPMINITSVLFLTLGGFFSLHHYSLSSLREVMPLTRLLVVLTAIAFQVVEFKFSARCLAFPFIITTALSLWWLCQWCAKRLVDVNILSFPFMIYAMHPDLQGGVKSILPRFFTPSPLIALFEYLLSSVGIIVGIILFSLLLRARCNPLYRVLSGGRT